MREVSKLLPQYDYEFYGDTANVPYGDKTEEEIFTLTKIGVEHLFQRDCALVVIACNTSSAETLRRLQDSILVDGYEQRRILGVIIPTVEEVVKSVESPVMLFATKRTVESGKYDRELKKLEANTVLQSEALSGLVPLIEGGQIKEATSLIVGKTKEARTRGINSVILGCTHYSLLKDKVGEVLGGEGKVFSQDEIIPDKLKDYLDRHPEIETTLSRSASRNIFLTTHRPEYDEVIRNLMGGVFISE